MAKKEKSLMRQLIEERGIKDMDGVHALVKELTAGLIQECMDVELEEELGYSRYDYKKQMHGQQPQRELQQDGKQQSG